MQFGVAKDLITPHVATHMGGYGNLFGKYFQGIHDDLYVKTLLLDDGKTKLVLVTFDLLFHDYELTQRIAGYLHEKHGVPEQNVVVSYTHTHAGPALKGYDPGQHSDEYEALLWDRIASCLDRACVNTFEGRIFFGSVEGDWNMSRRRLVDGRMVNAPNPEGDKDDTLSILRVCDAEGRERALLLNYSCHPVTLGDTLWISAEFPGRLCQLLDTKRYGTTAMFFQGAGGDSRPRIAADGEKWKKCTFEEVDEMASSMADAVGKALHADTLEPIELDLAARTFVIKLETEVYPREFFEQVVATAGGPAKNEAQLVLDRWDTTDNTIDLHAGLVRLSDNLYLAHMCGEVCYEVKQVVQEALGDRKLIFVGYGDAIAYIPGDRILAEGGYEADGSVVEYSLKGKFRRGINEQVRAAFARTLTEMEVGHAAI